MYIANQIERYGK